VRVDAWFAIPYLTRLAIAREKGGFTVPAERTRVEADGLGDWRLRAATRLMSDLPATDGGAPAHKVGSSVHLVTIATTPQHRIFSFFTPTVPALALNAGFRAAERAVAARSQIVLRNILTPDGTGAGIRVEDAPLMFDYFEDAFTAAISSFQAIEAFANLVIAQHGTAPMTLTGRRDLETLSAEEIVRSRSTAEKIGTVIPNLLRMPSIKGQSEWQRFLTLKRVRDDAMHFKSGEQYPHSGKVGKGSLFDILLNQDLCDFPLTALRVIWHVRIKTETERWLDHLAEKHGII
jgi:hypothetical protein